MLALLVAACFALAWVLRLGWIADYFSRPVLLGYIHGVAVVLDHRSAREARSVSRSTPATRCRSSGRSLHELGSVSGADGRCSARQRSSRSSRSASSCPRAAGGARSSSSQRSGSRGRSTCRRTASRSSARFPPACRASTCRRPAWQDVIQLVPAAVGIFLVSFADEILTARSFAGKHNQHVRASQELLAMGAANAAAGFTQGFSIGASGSRTAVNDSMGARSQVAGLVAAATVLVILLFLTEPVQYLPKAVLGAVIVFAAIGLIEPQAWRALAAVDHVEVAIAGVTTGCVIVFGVLEALVVAVGLSMIDTVRRSASPHDAVLGWVERLGRYADVVAAPDSRASRPASSSTASTTGSSSPTRATSRVACARRFARPRRRCPGSCSTPRRSRTSTRPGSTRSTELAKDLRRARDHARRRPAQDAHGGAVRARRRHRDDRAPSASTRRFAPPSPSASPPRRSQRPRANGARSGGARAYGATFWFMWKRLSGS